MAQQEQWQLGGNAPEMYERYSVPTAFGPMASLLLDLAAIQPGERVLDEVAQPGLGANETRYCPSIRATPFPRFGDARRALQAGRCTAPR